MLWLVIRIDEHEGDRPDHVRVRIPMGVVSVASKLLPGAVRAKVADHGIDIEALIAAADQLEPGVLVEVDDGTSRVVIALEASSSDDRAPARRSG